MQVGIRPQSRYQASAWMSCSVTTRPDVSDRGCPRNRDDAIHEHQRLVGQPHPRGKRVDLGELGAEHPGDGADGKLQAHGAIERQRLSRFHLLPARSTARGPPHKPRRSGGPPASPKRPRGPPHKPQLRRGRPPDLASSDWSSDICEQLAGQRLAKVLDEREIRLVRTRPWRWPWPSSDAATVPSRAHAVSWGTRTACSLRLDAARKREGEGRSSAFPLAGAGVPGTVCLRAGSRARRCRFRRRVFQDLAGRRRVWAVQLAQVYRDALGNQMPQQTQDR